MGESQIGRDVTAPRRVVVEIIAENPPISEADIVQSWVLRRPEMAVRHRRARPMAGLFRINVAYVATHLSPMTRLMTMAEDRGFEPLRAFTQHAFQACAIGH